MKTNQLFSLKRFWTYAVSSLTLHYRQLLLMTGAVAAGLVLLLSFLMFVNRNWSANHWFPFLTFVVPVAGLLYVGSAFPDLRSREKTIGFLMTPASSFEKFLYEFIERIVFFCVLFPILLYAVGNLTLRMIWVIKNAMNIPFSAESLFYGHFFEKVAIEEAQHLLVLGVFSALSLAFAGATVFRKLPLVKTIIFVCMLLFSIVGYFVLIFERMHLNRPWLEPYLENLGEQKIFTLFAILLGVFILTILSFAYFKLKEKEVS